MFENKTITIRISYVLLKYGANIDEFTNGMTLLQMICSQSDSLKPQMLRVTLDIVKFLLLNGADPYLPDEIEGKNCFDHAKKFCRSDLL